MRAKMAIMAVLHSMLVCLVITSGRDFLIQILSKICHFFESYIKLDGMIVL